MKLTLTLIALSGLALAGCTEKSGDTKADSPLAADCVILAGDPEAQENFAEMGTDTAGFCACMIRYVEAKPDTEEAQMKLALERVADGMEKSGEGAEEIVGLLMREIMMQGATGDAETVEAAEDLSAGISLVGMAIDDISNGFEDDGACPAR